MVGLSLKDALLTMESAEIDISNVRVHGQGVVISQWPECGVEVNKEISCELSCRRL